MGAGERMGTAHERVGEGTADAIRKIYPPDAACDAKLVALIESLERIPSHKSGKAQ